jgi:hypothetical protein
MTLQDYTLTIKSNDVEILSDSIVGLLKEYQTVEDESEKNVIKVILDHISEKIFNIYSERYNHIIYAYVELINILYPKLPKEIIQLDKFFAVNIDNSERPNEDDYPNSKIILWDSERVAILKNGKTRCHVIERDEIYGTVVGEYED